MKREHVTDLIVAAKIRKGIKWSELANLLGTSKEWATAALLGQMTLNPQQAAAVVDMLELPAEAGLLLQQVPYKGSLPSAVPTDPLI